MTDTKYNYQVCEDGNVKGIDTLCKVMKKGGLGPEVAAFRTKYNALQKRMAKTEGVVASTQNKLNATLEVKNVLLKQSKAEREKEQNAAKEEIANLEKEKVTLQAQLELVKSKSAKTQEEVVARGANIEQLNKDLANRADEIEALKQRSDELEVLLKNHDKARDDLNKTIEALKAQVEKGGKTMDEQLAERDNLIKLLQAVNEDYKAMQKQLDESGDGDGDGDSGDEDFGETMVETQQQEEKVDPDVPLTRSKRSTEVVTTPKRVKVTSKKRLTDTEALEEFGEPQGKNILNLVKKQIWENSKLKKIANVTRKQDLTKDKIIEVMRNSEAVVILQQLGYEDMVTKGFLFGDKRYSKF